MPTRGARPLTLFAARRAAADAGRVVLVLAYWRAYAHEVIDREVRDRRRRRKLHAYVDLLADACHGWRWTGTVVLTHADAAAALGCCERTVSYLRADLDRLGLLTTAREGTTPAWREASGSGVEGNHAPVYVLTRLVEAVPHDTPDEVDDTAENRCESAGSETSCTPLLGSPRREGKTAAVEAIEHVEQVLAAAGVSSRWLDRKADAVGLGGLSRPELGHLLRYAPDGTPWRFGPGARRRVAVVVWMLRAWAAELPTDGDLAVLRDRIPPELDVERAAAHRRHLLAEAARIRQDRAARRAQATADRAAAAPPPVDLRAAVEARRARLAASRAAVEAQDAEARRRRREHVAAQVLAEVALA